MRKNNNGVISRSNFTSKLNDNRIYFFLGIVFVVMAFAYPAFFQSSNMTALLTTCLLFISVGIGFTFVMITGNFDLSIGAIINAGAVMVMGEFNRFYKILGGADGGTGALVGAWVIAFAIAIAVGIAIGALNGFLVARLQVHSFIVTIGMMTAIGGFVYTYSQGNTISADNYMLSEVIDKSFTQIPYLQVFTPRLLIVVAMVAIFEFVLHKTSWGKDLLMVGSNQEAAWYAGINTERKVWMAFIISGFTAAVGGALFAVGMNAAVPNFGERGISPLMMVLASTIIGGTVMTGGSGSVVKTAFAVVTIQSIFNGLISMGLGFDAQVLAAGVLLSAVVFYESFSIYRQNLRKGERPALIAEAERMKRDLSKR